MLHILLLIFKIIGYLLLGILGLAVALLLIILFVPIRYRVSGNSRDQQYAVKASVSWILHILHISAVYDTTKLLQIRARLFGFAVWKKDLAIPPQRSSEKEEYSDEELEALFAEEEGITSQESEPAPVKTEPTPGKPEPVPEKPESAPVKTESTPVKTDPAPAKTDADPPNNKSVSENAESSEKKQKTKQKFGSDQPKKKAEQPERVSSEPSKFQSLRDKIQTGTDKAKEFWSFVQSPVFTKALQKLKKEGFLILHRILPRHAKADITYGFENPETTGKMLGILSILNAQIPAKVVLTPDFEKAICYGDGNFTGYIMIIQLLLPAARLLFNKEIRYCIKQFRKK